MGVLAGNWRRVAVLYVTAAAVFTVLALAEVLFIGRTSGPPTLSLLALGIALTFGLTHPRVLTGFVDRYDAVRSSFPVLRNAPATLGLRYLVVPHVIAHRARALRAWKDVSLLSAQLDLEYRLIESTHSQEWAALRNRAALTNVLVATDRSVLAVPVIESLTNLGFAVSTHVTGAQLLEHLRSIPSEVVIMDLTGKAPFAAQYRWSSNTTFVIDPMNAEATIPLAFKGVFETKSPELSGQLVRVLVRALRDVQQLRVSAIEVEVTAK